MSFFADFFYILQILKQNTIRIVDKNNRFFVFVLIVFYIKLARIKKKS